MNKTINISTNIRYIFEYGLVLIVVFLLENLSAKTIYRLGCLLGNVAYILATKRKRIALVNLNIAFGDKSSEKKKKKRPSRILLPKLLYPYFSLYGF